LIEQFIVFNSGSNWLHLLFCDDRRIHCCCIPQVAIMQNEEGKMVDLYVPRKCSATNRIITAKDHASVQINIGHLDENGLYDGRFTTFALSGFVRAQVLYSCYPDSSLYAFILHINLLFVLCYHSCEMCLSFVDWILV